jgi:hypothetical protein
MLSADCIGFHTYDYARHFISSCKRVLDVDHKTLSGGILAIDYCGRRCSLRIGHLGMCAERVKVLNETLKNINKLKLKTKRNEIKCFLSKESDSLNCYIEVHAGAGGTESQDWAEMLRKMYMKWALGKDFKTLSFLIISKESNEVFPQTPHDELVKKFLLILSISTFSELFNVIRILF